MPLSIRSLPSVRPETGLPRTDKVVSWLMVTLLATLATVVTVAPESVAAESNAKVQVLKAVFATKVSDDFQASGETTSFQRTDTVNLLLRLKGRPKKGKVSAQWNFRNSKIDVASVELSDVKGGFFSRGGDTFVKFFLQPDKDGLPIGKSYLVDVTIDGKPLGKYGFSIVPPRTSIPTKLTKAFLSKTKEGSPSTSFAAADEVYLNITANFGAKSWVEATWTINGTVDPKGTRSLVIEKDAKATPAYFFFRPDNGWPKGKHSVALVLNDETVGTYRFSVA
jgi:hypothetical protein